MRSYARPLLAGLLTIACSVSACGGNRSETTIAVDGSSTVYPITEAVAEEFRAQGVAEVTIGVSGTGGGFKKFCAKETVITGASRPVKPSELELCRDGSVEFVEIPVAYDGIAIVVHQANTWVDEMTVEELRRLWAPDAQGSVTKWSDIREGWPEEEIHLFGPGVDSGTYDYFTKAIVGREHASRGDFTSSEDDNVLVQGISTDKQALGFFGFAYFAENRDRLKIVPINDGNDDNGAGAITPSPASVQDGTYQPLSRPVFIYVSKEASARDEVRKFVHFYLAEVESLAREVGYIPLTSEEYDLARKRFDDGRTGSAFGGEGSKVGVTVAELLAEG